MTAIQTRRATSSASLPRKRSLLQSCTAHGSTGQDAELQDLRGIRRGTTGRYRGATGVLCADRSSKTQACWSPPTATSARSGPTTGSARRRPYPDRSLARHRPAEPLPRPGPAPRLLRRCEIIPLTKQEAHTASESCWGPRRAQYRGLSPKPGRCHDRTIPSAALVPVTPVFANPK